MNGGTPLPLPRLALPHIFALYTCPRHVKIFTHSTGMGKMTGPYDDLYEDDDEEEFEDLLDDDDDEDEDDLMEEDEDDDLDL